MKKKKLIKQVKKLIEARKPFPGFVGNDVKRRDESLDDAFVSSMGLVKTCYVYPGHPSSL